MKEIRIVQATGGYIVTSVDQATSRQELKVYTNFGAIVKDARVLFDEVIVKGKKDEESGDPVPATE